MTTALEEEGSTPIDPDEVDDLIPQHIETNSELNQWEALNIANAHAWLGGQRLTDPLSVDWLAELHRRMFDATWKWAGILRRSDKNVSPFNWTQVPVLMRELVENTRAQYEASDHGPEVIDEIAIRFHHRLVLIHPWPNGNGRHARLATDALLVRWGRPAFSWGSGANLVGRGEPRQKYLEALRAGDRGSFDLLLDFSRG